MDLTDFRQEHLDRGLVESEAAADPLVQFDRWFEEARRVGYHQPEAMVVATVDEHGRPSARFVLMRDHGPEGFVFYTDFESAKGHDIAANDAVAILFPWQELGRQVRIRGRARAVGDEASDEYWRRRPRGSQLAASTSNQSRPVDDRRTLEDRYEATAARHPEGVAVPRPARWGGYVVEPAEYEFWQQRAYRFHDRLRYRHEGSGWRRERLEP